jgi:hypothetical protein
MVERKPRAEQPLPRGESDAGAGHLPSHLLIKVPIRGRRCPLYSLDTVEVLANDPFSPKNLATSFPPGRDP